jgi:hypothetical protein
MLRTYAEPQQSVRRKSFDRLFGEAPHGIVSGSIRGYDSYYLVSRKVFL